MAGVLYVNIAIMGFNRLKEILKLQLPVNKDKKASASKAQGGTNKETARLRPSRPAPCGTLYNLQLRPFQTWALSLSSA